jgi:isopentenyl-diphosphate delta-isomerase
MANQQLLLVDKKDKIIGTAEKMRVHQEGLLHRAFSIIILNSQGEMLMQLRAKNKYHSGGLWTNACCSHPRPGEILIKAARERLAEEMGIDCGLKEIFSFHYRAVFANGLIENEYDHVLLGECDATPKPNLEEADDWRWAKIGEIKKDVKQNPVNYTYWFKQIMKKIDWSKYVS